MKYALITSIIVGIAGAIGSIIYICSIYNSILTSMPLWMIICFIILFWVAIVTVFLLICFALKKHL